MECNREEAIRAKDIAVSKMKNGDFAGARKIAAKAQKLYSELENVSQMLMVCDMHCAAEKKLLGNECDWYNILQVEPTADIATIKKQYRKFALVLHPDKNKFPGAEASFKLIGEAQRVLLDQGKRALLDMKRRSSSTIRPQVPHRPQPHPRPTWPSNARMPQSNFAGMNPHLQQKQQRQMPGQQASFDARPTFWTTCPFCSVKYQYFRDVIHKSIRCQSCHKTFVTYESFGPQATRPPSFSQSFPQQTSLPNQGGVKMENGQQTRFPNQGGVNATQRNVVQDKSKPCPPKASTVGVEKASSNKKRKQAAQSSESSFESSSDEDVAMDDDVSKHSSNGSVGKSQRRSVRNRQNVSYKENLSDDDEMTPKKKSKGSGSSPAADENINNGPDAGAKEPEVPKQKESASFEKVILNEKQQDDKMKGKTTTVKDGSEGRNGAHDSKENVDVDSLSDCSAKDPESYSYPDPDFNDFDKDKNEECFAVGQIWAIYDTVDAMPRFYAQIRKVFSPFKLKITWLEPEPEDEKEIKWVNEELPVSCGRYRRGDSEETGERSMFSHRMSWEKTRSKLMMFPRKGETWALFKNWNMSWSSDADKNKKYEYEFIEILTPYTKGVGLNVAYLAKVKGFVSLFCRVAKEGKGEFQIPSDELLRFSHRIPSFKLTGEEREGIPKGSFELDPAALPLDLLEIDVPAEMKPEVIIQHTGCSKPSDKLKPPTGSVEAEVKKSHVQAKDDVIVIEEDSGTEYQDPEEFEIPDPEFFRFDTAKSPTNVKVDQIWSLYCEEDGLPKYYAQITRIELTPELKLHIRWLESRKEQSGLKLWLDKKIPACTGRYKIGDHADFKSTDAFSHLVNFEPAAKGENEYIISPRKGEVWALYRDWSVYMELSDLEKCAYDIVEVVSETAMQISVHCLERVNGFNTVYKIRMEGKLPSTRIIPRTEMLRFSHQIPYFRLSSEKGGSLRGFLELDPCALPINCFKS
ncbi:uncharacterized protein [Rutidosis leptorrhynchoides]|uniref:uncharacterized protein n=1 Tax=Rutidosis leptorrhynchoides TaxID=125765 RepID=UPI003A996847